MKNPVIMSVSDGYYEYSHPRQLLFPGVAEADLIAAGVPGKEWKTWKSPYTATLIQTEDTTILVDTGAGNIAKTTGLIFENLKQNNIHPDDIDIIILTHLHPDHIGGLLPSDGRPAFPNARIIMSDLEHSYWQKEPDLHNLSIPPEARNMICTMATDFLQRYSNRIETLPMYTQLTPHISLFAAPGHTPGHIGVEVQTDDTLFLIAGDAFLHPAHFTNPEWSSSVDIMPETATRTRRHILERIHSESAKLLGFHL